MFPESIGIGLALSPDLPSLKHGACYKFEAFNSMTRHHPLIKVEHSGPGLLIGVIGTAAMPIRA
jgi:hypothetical protein